MRSLESSVPHALRTLGQKRPHHRRTTIQEVGLKKLGRPSLQHRRLPVILALAAQGWTRLEIAEHLNISSNSLRCLLYRARKDGLLTDTMDRLINHAVPLAIDNIIYHLERGDKEMTLETMKGVGLFRQHKAVEKEASSGPTVLAVRFEMPAGTSPTALPPVIEGSVVGKEHE